MALAASLPCACLRFSAEKICAGDMQNFLANFSQLHATLLISGREVREPPRFLAPLPWRDRISSA